MTGLNRMAAAALLSMITSLALAGDTPLRLRLGREGDIFGWLVAGPYPNDGALERKGVGFKTDYLSGEAQAAPHEGTTNQGCTWKLATGNRSRGIDLKRAISDQMPAIGYCYTVLESKDEFDGAILFGSDDGAKAFLNGKQLFSKQVARGVKRDEDRFAIHLHKGDNRLLFKVEQGNGDWGLMARVVDSLGNPSQGIVQRLDITVDRLDASALSNGPRVWAGTPGALDLEAFESYGSLAHTARVWLKNLSSESKQPELLRQALEKAGMQIYAGLGNADLASKAYEEAIPEIRKAYDTVRAPFLKWAQNPGPLVRTETRDEDFVAVMNGGRYFVHANGKPFIPIGCNHNPDWPELEESNPLANDYDPDRTDRWFAKLSANGINVVRLMVETPQSGNLEEKPGLFRPEHLRWLDTIFLAARKHGVKLWITPYDTFWMSLRSDACPYWAVNGGPIVKPIDFLTKPEIIDLQKKRMKYLIDRYGNTGTVFAWEVMNEIDIWWNADPAQIKAWTDQMVAFVRGYQRKRWGRDHLVTISMADAEPKDGNADTAFRRSDLDFATMHLYLGASRGPKPGEAVQAGEDFAAGVRYARSQIRDNRPVLDGESGPIDHWISDGKFDDEVFYQMSWQHLMAGGAGAGTRWHPHQPHQISDGMIAALHTIRTFSDGVEWKDLVGPSVDIRTSEPGSPKIDGFETARGGLAWVRVPKGTNGRSVTLSLSLASPTRYRLFDSRRGAWLGPENSVPATGIRIEFPAGVDDIAVFFRA